MSKIIIFGAGRIGTELLHELIANGEEVICFLDNHKKIGGG